MACARDFLATLGGDEDFREAVIGFVNVVGFHGVIFFVVASPMLRGKKF